MESDVKVPVTVSVCADVQAPDEMALVANAFAPDATVLVIVADALFSIAFSALGL